MNEDIHSQYHHKQLNESSAMNQGRNINSTCDEWVSKQDDEKKTKKKYSSQPCTVSDPKKMNETPTHTALKIVSI